jgi:hypothetical protein
MARHQVECSNATEVTVQLIQCGTQSWAAIYIRSGEMTVSAHATEANDCDRIAQAFAAVAAELRAAKTATPSPALVAALAADERKAA